MDLPLSLRALALALMLVAPVAASLPASTPGGILIVGPDTIGAGVTREYRDGTFFVLGDVVVEDGGTLVFERADIVFVAGAWVITVEPGGRFVSTQSELRPDPSVNLTEELAPGFVDREFRVDVEPGALFDLVDTTVRGGRGVEVASSATTISNVTFVDNLRGLTLREVDLAIEALNFTNNTVGLAVLGGTVSVDGSWFDRNTNHVLAQDSNLTFRDSEVHAGLEGLRAVRGTSHVERSLFLEHLGPDTVGVWLTDVTEARLADNTIRDWSIAVRIEGGGAALSGNEISSSECCTTLVTASRHGADLAPFLVSNNSFTSGDVRFESPEEAGVFDIVDNTFLASDLRAIGTARVLRNELNTGTIYVGSGNVSENDVLGGGIHLWWGGEAWRNVVQNGGMCYSLSETRSTGNVAASCITGFDLSGSSTVSIGDSATGLIFEQDPAWVRGFVLHDKGGELRRPTVEGPGIGIEVSSGEGGWRVSNATVRGALAGVHIREWTWNATVVDSLLDANEVGVRHEGRTLYLDRTRVLASSVAAVTAMGGTVTGSRNHFAGNAWGVSLLTDGFATLPDSYWGSPTGPTVASNPGGTGDAVSPGVVYAPFLTSPP